MSEETVHKNVTSVKNILGDEVSGKAVIIYEPRYCHENTESPLESLGFCVDKYDAQQLLNERDRERQSTLSDYSDIIPRLAVHIEDKGYLIVDEKNLLIPSVIPASKKAKARQKALSKLDKDDLIALELL